MSDFDYKAIDDVIHGRLRLAVMAFLMTARAADFSELMKVTGATDGNLSAQLKVLESHAYVQLERGYIGARPNLRVVLTQAGQHALSAYIAKITALIQESTPDETA